VISYKDTALQIISYSRQAAYNCYLLPNGVTEQTRPSMHQTTRVRHDVTAGLHCWQYWTKFLLYPQNGHI